MYTYHKTPHYESLKKVHSFEMLQSNGCLKLEWILSQNSGFQSYDVRVVKELVLSLVLV